MSGSAAHVPPSEPDVFGGSRHRDQVSARCGLRWPAATARSPAPAPPLWTLAPAASVTGAAGLGWVEAGGLGWARAGGAASRPRPLASDSRACRPCAPACCPAGGCHTPSRLLAAAAPHWRTSSRQAVMALRTTPAGACGGAAGTPVNFGSPGRDKAATREGGGARWGWPARRLAARRPLLTRRAARHVCSRTPAPPPRAPQRHIAQPQPRTWCPPADCTSLCTCPPQPPTTGHRAATLHQQVVMQRWPPRVTQRQPAGLTRPARQLMPP